MPFYEEWSTDSRQAKHCPLSLSVGFTGSDETLNKGGIPVFLLLCLKKKEARGWEA
jgi:hypothetical protein